MEAFLDRIEKQYGKLRRTWLMDRGIPTEETLEKMRSRGIEYLVGTPKGRLTHVEKPLLEQPWTQARESVRVKILQQESEFYVYWEFYLLLTRVEQAFKDLKGTLSIRPIWHQVEERIEAHIFVSFLAYCLHTTLRNLARGRAAGLTSEAVLKKLSNIQMIDVHLPTTDGRHVVLSRYTQPEKDVSLLLAQLGLTLPDQPPPKVYATGQMGL